MDAARSLALALFFFALCSATHAAEPILDCTARGPATPICGFQNPEDLAVLPGDQAMVVSEYGAMEGGRAGGLRLLVIADSSAHPLFRGGDAKGAARAGWGDPSCPGAPSEAFSPHGIDIAPRPDGRLQLAVVQHGGRESIELFEVSGKDEHWQLEWRGCVIPPAGSWLNEVVLLPDGGLLTSHMMSREAGLDQMMEPGAHPGHLYHWAPERGFRKLPGTEGPLVNGIEISPDGRKIFVNITGANEVRRVDRATGAIEARADVPGPDNSTWAPDGALLVASLLMGDSTEFEQCMGFEKGACPMPFQIVALDPKTLQSSVRYRGGGPDSLMGAGTVGLQVGSQLFMGSFAGDRVLRVDLGAPVSAAAPKAEPLEPRTSGER